MPKITNPRQKKMEQLATKIAMFIVEETYTNEQDLQEQLAEVSNILSAAGKKMAENDAKWEAEQKAGK